MSSEKRANDGEEGGAPASKKAKVELPEATAKWFKDTVKVMNIIIEEKKQDIVVLRYDATVAEASQVLAQHHILSAPVTATGDKIHNDKDDFFLGIFSTETILKAVMNHELIAEAEEGKRWAKLDAVAKEIGGRKLVSVLRSGESHYFAKPMTDASLHDVILQGFFGGDAKTMLPAHRLAVWERNHLQTLLTQSDVLKYLQHHQDHLKPFADKTLKQLGLNRKTVVTVPESTIAADAFRMMVAENVTSVGIVDQAGQLVSNLSASDIRGLTINDLAHLATENVMRFLELRKAELRKVNRHKEKHLKTVHSGTHLSTVIKEMVDNKIHRVYVQDNRQHPIGIITITDVLQLFVDDEVVTKP